DTVEVQGESVVQFTADDRGRCTRLFVRVGAQAVDDRRIGDQIEDDFVFLILGRRRAAQGRGHYGACDERSYDSAVPQLTDAIGIHFYDSLLFNLDDDSLEFDACLQLKTSIRPVMRGVRPRHSPPGSVAKVNGRAWECPQVGRKLFQSNSKGVARGLICLPFSALAD